MNSQLVMHNVLDIEPAPCRPSSPTPAAPHDALTALLDPCRIRCHVDIPWRLSAPWGIEFPRPGAWLFVVLEGECRLRADGLADDLRLERDHLTVVTRNTPFVLTDPMGQHTVPSGRVLSSADLSANGQLLLGGGGRMTRLVAARLSADDDYTQQAFTLLPPLVMTRGGSPGADAINLLVRALIGELCERKPGGELVINRLLQTLLVAGLREVPPRLPDSEEDGLVSALRVPGLGTALGAIHARPDHEWTVRELADVAGLSRAAFAVRFVEVLGRPPFHYLRDVRMRLACQHLRDSERGIKEIAARVGYATEASFSKAFTRWCGSAPGEYRRQNRRPRGRVDGAHEVAGEEA